MANIANKYHYFYKITNNINGHFYYGVHNTNNLDDGYMGSGTRLHYAYKKYGIENFTKEILKYFNTSKEAFEYEAEVVNESLIKNDNCYNIKPGGSGWQTLGLITVKDKDGNCFNTNKDDPRYLSGELTGVTKGLITVKDKDGNCFDTNKDDPRYLSGKLTGITKGFITVKDKEGNYHYVSTNDEKYINGEYFSNFKNMVNVVDLNGNMFNISKNDPRYLNGELKYFTANKILVKDLNNNFFWISKDDPRYLSGEVKNFWKDKKHKEESLIKMKNTMKYINHQQGEKNSQYGTCWIYNDKESIKIKKEQLDEYISKGWKKGRKIKF